MTETSRRCLVRIYPGSGAASSSGYLYLGAIAERRSSMRVSFALRCLRGMVGHALLETRYGVAHLPVTPA